MKCVGRATLVAAAFLAVLGLTASPPASVQQKPNIVILKADDSGWGRFGGYSGGGLTLVHPTPNVDRIAKEGAIFTNWYGQVWPNRDKNNLLKAVRGGFDAIELDV